MKKLSIIIPVYNNERYLSECIESIILSKKKFEIILVDDGSTDNSANICKKYSEKEPRIKTFNKKNSGVSSARNFGLEHATGEYIMFVDSDDILSSNWDIIFNYINNNDIYYFDSRIKNKTNKDTLLKYITGANKENIYLSGPYSKLFKTTFIKHNNLKFNNKLVNGEDMIFNIEAAMAANNYEFIKFQFYSYRQTSGQATRRFDNSIINSDIKFHKILDSILKKSDINSNTITEIENFCLTNAVKLITNRISYIHGYQNAKKYFSSLEKPPYKTVIDKEAENDFLLKLCKFKKYRIIFNMLKFRNRLSMLSKKIKCENFIKI